MQLAVGEREVKRLISAELEGRILSAHRQVCDRMTAFGLAQKATKAIQQELKAAQEELSFTLSEAEDGQTTLFKPEEESDAAD